MRLFDKMVGYERKLVIMLTCGVAYPKLECGRYRYHEVFSRAGDFMGKVATCEVTNFVARVRREFNIERDKDPCFQHGVNTNGLPAIVFDPANFGLTSGDVIQIMQEFWEFETYLPEEQSDIAFSWREPDMWWLERDRAKPGPYIWIEPFSGAYPH